MRLKLSGFPGQQSTPRTPEKQQEKEGGGRNLHDWYEFPCMRPVNNSPILNVAHYQLDFLWEKAAQREQRIYHLQYRVKLRMVL